MENMNGFDKHYWSPTSSDDSDKEEIGEALWEIYRESKPHWMIQRPPSPKLDDNGAMEQYLDRLVPSFNNEACNTKEYIEDQERLIEVEKMLEREMEDNKKAAAEVTKVGDTNHGDDGQQEKENKMMTKKGKPAGQQKKREHTDQVEDRKRSAEEVADYYNKKAKSQVNKWKKQGRQRTVREFFN